MDAINFSIIITNILYSVSGVIIGLIALMLGYYVLDKITPFDTGKELDEGNTAIGIVVGSVFISLGLCVGLIVGMGLN